MAEFAGWREWQPTWRGRHKHVTGYHALAQQLVIVGGVDALGIVDDQWLRDASGAWHRSLPDVAARSDAVMAYDSTRGRLVLFGGLAGQPLGDTWEYDGTTWTQRMIAGPPARYGAGMAFDSSRGRMVLYGGRGNAGSLGDTWEYDGVAWTEVTMASPPAARLWPALAYDPTRNRVAMFGGYINGARFETYELVAGAWSLMAQTTRPAARYGVAMAFSVARNKIVLFGGARGLDSYASDSWEYDGTWTPIAPALSPPGRAWATLTQTDAAELVLVEGRDNAQGDRSDVWDYSPASWTDSTPPFWPSSRLTPMVYDPTRHETLLYSGCGAGNLAADSDTWRFARTGGEVEWTRGATPPPETRCYPALAADSRAGRVVLFGGATQGNTANRDETWQWDGTQWTDISSAQRPTARTDAAFVESVRDQALVLFGGRLSDGSYTNETWELDGDTWMLGTTPPELAAQHGATMAYDPVHERVVLLDNSGGTWERRDHAWSQLAVDSSPEPRAFARMVWDPWRRKIVLFGGSGTGQMSGVDYGDLWELGEHGWTKIRLLGAQPPLRARPALAPYPELRGLVLYGGIARGDTWILQFVSDTPEEGCANGQDDDGDLQVDALDPDCTDYP